ncbi:MAG UNVERIFIED_CONTAM: hypothetical protein LVQ98_08325 [Rickettsiaceae bacterium]|jgi:hypothetical protein
MYETNNQIIAYIRQNLNPRPERGELLGRLQEINDAVYPHYRNAVQVKYSGLFTQAPPVHAYIPGTAPRYRKKLGTPDQEYSTIADEIRKGLEKHDAQLPTTYKSSAPKKGKESELKR